MDKIILEKVKEAFDANPEAETFYVTADGQCFKHDDDADRHQQNVDKTKAIIKVFKEQLDALGQEAEKPKAPETPVEDTEVKETPANNKAGGKKVEKP